MCGSLRRTEIKPGEPVKQVWLRPYSDSKVTVETTQGSATTSMRWSGWAKKENIRYWESLGWKRAMLSNMDGFSERDSGGKPHYFSTYGRSIAIMVKNKEFMIVTRPSQGMEKQVHERFPYLVFKG